MEKAYRSISPRGCLNRLRNWCGCHIIPSFNRQEIHLAAALAEASAVTAKTQGAGLATVGTKALPAGGAKVEMIRPRNQDPPAAFADARPQPGAEAAQLTTTQSHARNPCARSLRRPTARLFSSCYAPAHRIDSRQTLNHCQEWSPNPQTTDYA